MLLLLYAVLGVVAGALLPLQAGVNAQLALWLGSPIRAAVANFVVGLVALLLLVAVFVRGKPAERLGDTPWWVWAGGLCGAFFVAANALIAPRLGALTLFGVILLGQAVASIAIDKWGLFGFREQAVGPGRVAGLALVAAGVAMVRYL